MEGAYYTASFYKTFSTREKKLMNELFGPSALILALSARVILLMLKLSLLVRPVLA